MADIITFLVILLMAAWGWKSGFIKAVFHLGYYIISAVAAFTLYPILSKILINSKLSVFIHDKIIMPRISVNTVQMNLPSFLQQAVDSGVNNTTQTLATSLTEMIINIICFIVVFLIVRFGLRIVVGLLDGIAKLPLLNAFNKVGGIAVGVINGFLAVYLLLALATIFMSEKLYSLINASTYTIQMYNNNILLKILFG